MGYGKKRTSHTYLIICGEQFERVECVFEYVLDSFRLCETFVYTVEQWHAFRGLESLRIHGSERCYMGTGSVLLVESK